MITVEDVKEHPITKTFIKKGDEHLGTMGFTEHSYRHKNLVSNIAANILERLGFPKREAELAAIAGYLHDIGNVVSRYNHGQSGAMIAYDILRDLKMDPEEIAIIIAAIGNHEEEYGQSVNNVAAALILADKSDVHRSRVRNPDVSTFDIHDRVNYGAVHSFLNVDPQQRKVTLELKIDQNITTVMEYFEIFLTRMVMCRRAAEFLDASFGLVINDAKLL
ncbi:metal dependent phosphohydrolase [Anaerobranca californiensis DSM 14826]|jgi:metal-dependent HD superfamily phosphatase/phosphodiesterase|uniref:Metal dependent phosphohydrolase n=1 Tax=Anaerobranca californiensis DSM 14826 TaxID=1120989 RepID=A0A1M6LN15_9FIRM|nr:HD domain-containing protein [Anaerobranca californiensis]SHJ72628.1 metal dependent phosphohydrolase [Anaerobranca californiensis DSM 14826]